MTVTVVLNGDVESCCSFFTADEIAPMVRGWMPDGHDLVTIDRETTAWEPDGIATVAERYFAEEAYPLVYIDGTLCTFGALPSRKNLVAYLNGERSFGVSEQDIIGAARAMKKIPAEET
jgi:hypothetical protein